MSYVTLPLLLVVGCGTQNTAAKTSHFDHDHEVAPHWPSDLADAAAKIRQRLAWYEHGHGHEHEHEHRHSADRDPGVEIADPVNWVPEIAADTNLSERDWIPLDVAAESLSASLRASGNELTETHRRQAVAFCELIEHSLAKIPDQPLSWKGSSP